MERQKRIISIRLYEDQIKMAKELSLNISEWARNKFDEEFSALEVIDEKIKNIQKELENLSNQKDLIKSTLNKITQKEEVFFNEAREILIKNPSYLKGQCIKYKAIFNKLIKPSELLKRCKL
jgi:hypothetical protein